MARKKKIIDVKKADEVLSDERIQEIVDKEWKTAELPSEEQLASEEPSSPKARSNSNSRANLIQYRKDKPKEVKEKIVKQLQFRSTRQSQDISEFFGDMIKPDDLIFLEAVRDILRDGDEESLFFGLFKQFLLDFPRDELSASDLDDLISLVLNRVLELRLLKVAKGQDKAMLDSAGTIERLRKNSEKLKMGLASRRMDRVDTKNKQSFSIVDIAVAYDTEKRARLEDMAKGLEADKEEFKRKKLKALKDLDER